jgi:hypothetical protein
LLVVANLLIVGLFSSARAVPEPISNSPPAPEPQLRLLAELTAPQRLALQERHGATLREAQAQAAAEMAAAQAAEMAALVCRMWGPYGTQSAYDTLHEQLTNIADSVEIRASQIQGSPDYLVYVDTESNIDTAKRMQQELKSQSMEAYVMNGGLFVNALSVGVFSERSRAENQRRKAEKLGYKVAIEALPRPHEVYHLIAHVPKNFVAEAAPVRDCATIASVQ